MYKKFSDEQFWENVEPNFPYILGIIRGNKDSEILRKSVCIFRNSEEILRECPENVKICEFKKISKEIFLIFWK